MVLEELELRLLNVQCVAMEIIDKQYLVHMVLPIRTLTVLMGILANMTNYRKGESYKIKTKIRRKLLINLILHGTIK